MYGSRARRAEMKGKVGWIGLMICLLCVGGPVAEAVKKRSPYARYIKTIKKRLRQKPRSARLHTILGRLYQKAGQPKLAGQSYRQALRFRPGFSHARVGLARLALQRGQLAKARRLLRRVLRRHKEHAPALTTQSEYWRKRAQRAKTPTQQKRYFMRAIRTQQRAVIAKPKVHRYRYRLGILYLAAHQYAMAHVQFATALGQLSFHPCYNLGLSTAEALMKRARASQYKDLKKGVLGCRHPLLLKMGQSMLVMAGMKRAQQEINKKRPNKAVALMREVTQLAPQQAEGYTFLAMLQYQNQQCQAARRTLKRLLQRQPGHGGAKKLLRHSKALRCGPLSQKPLSRKKYMPSSNRRKGQGTRSGSLKILKIRRSRPPQRRPKIR